MNPHSKTLDLSNTPASDFYQARIFAAGSPAWRTLVALFSITPSTLGKTRERRFPC